MKHLLFFFLLLVTGHFSNAGEFPFFTIPQPLLKNANVVKRLEEIRFEIKSTRQAKYTRRVVYTILNEKGDDYAQMTESYDKILWEEPSIQGTLYDAMGTKIKSTKKTDIRDYSNVDEGTLAANDRVRTHNFYHKVYPYTVEYLVEQDYNATMFFPGWIPCPASLLSVESSSMTVVLPAGESFRYKSVNGAGEPVVKDEGSKKVYEWKLNHFPAIVGEYAAPVITEITPVVFMGPSRFFIEGYEGEMNTWKEYGSFVHSLKKDKVELPAAVKQKVHELTDGISDLRQKTERLYQYMQQTTRYISIQLGIGGWQPFPASFVAEKKYGDCKALTNYMYALLKEAGIPSGYTVIKSRNKFFHPDFPSSQFDHVILCVPQPNDSIWLECTSQTLPAGYLSSFTHDRYAVYVNEEGGHLLRTPTYGKEQNLQLRRIKAMADAETGELKIQASTLYKAMQQDALHSMLQSLTREKILEHLKGEIDLPHYDVVAFDYKELPGKLPELKEELTLVAGNYLQISNKRMFLLPNILIRSTRKLTADTSRKFPVLLDYSFRDIDSVEIEIPAGYTAEAVPKDQQFESKFGSYYSVVKVMPGKVVYYRRHEQTAGKFEPSDYKEMVQFFDKIYAADRARVVLVKKEE